MESPEKLMICIMSYLDLLYFQRPDWMKSEYLELNRSFTSNTFVISRILKCPSLKIYIPVSGTVIMMRCL